MEKLAHLSIGLKQKPAVELLLNQLIRQRLTTLIVFTEPLENALIPDPVFKHLRRQLNKVLLNSVAGEARKVGCRAHVVHDVAELVEESFDFVVVHERWLALFRWIEVDYHCSGCSLDVISDDRALDKREHCGVVELSLTRVQVQVKQAKELVAFFIEDLVAGDITSPGLALALLKVQAKKLLVDGHGLSDDMFRWEVLGQFILINLVLL